MYSREFPTGGNFLFFVVCMMSLFRLPCGKLAFAQRSGAMKAPVGLLSDRTVLRKQDGGALPRQVTAGLPRCSSRQGWPGRMPVPDIGIGGSVCGLFLFVQTHAPLIVPPWQSRARKSKFQFLSGARARMFSALHLRLVAR